MLIEITDDQVEKLLSCKKTTLRGFKRWAVKNLMDEAIYEFYCKYSGEKNE